MSAVQEKINRILEGSFDYENGTLDFSCSKIELALSKGSIQEGSFYINSIPGRPTDGCVVSSDLRMECLTPEFSGSSAEIAYCFHGEHMEEGDVVKGAFYVISNQGEYYLPFVVSIEHTILTSSIGNIRNLFHFANLAKSSWKEALKLFYSPDFKSILTGNDGRFLGAYRGLSAHAGNEQNMEEFLIYINKKQQVEYYAKEAELAAAMALAEGPYTVTEREVEIVRNGWGYTALNVECEGDFLFTEKEFLTDDDFLGNVCRLSVFLDTGRCREGRNFGRIFIFNSYVSLVIPVEVRIGEESLGRRVALTRKQITVQLMKAYEAFRLKKSSTSVWLKETGRLVERLVSMDEDDIAARLFQAQVLITEERFNEAGWILDHAADLIEQSVKDVDVLYAYHWYLTTLLPGGEQHLKEAAARVEQIYRRRRGEWRVAWLLLYLSDEYGRSAAGKWSFLREQFDRGCVSPVIYIEALFLLNANPPLMRRLEGFELQVLYYGARQDCLGEETVGQLLYLCGRKREYSRVLLNVLERLYGKRREVRILQEICTLLIKGGRTGAEYLEWYQRGVDAQLRITNLYEYYMMSLDMGILQPIPKIVLLYFSYQNNLDYERSAYLYHYLIQNREEFPKLYEGYRARIERFAAEQLQKEHINRHLAALYQEILSEGQLSAQMAEPLSRMLFANWIEVEDSRLRKVFVYQPGKIAPTEYILQDSSTWVVLYGDEYAIVFEDAYGNRFVKSAVYFLEKLMLPGKYLRSISCYVKDSQGLNLYLCEHGKDDGQVTSEQVERYLQLAESDDVADEVRREFSMKVLQFYYDADNIRALDQYLDAIGPERLTMEERGTVVRYMVLRGKYQKAYGWVREYGPYFAEPKLMVRLLNDLIQQNRMVEDGVLTAAALYAFRKGKYDSCILEYLTRYYRGMTKEMRDIWKAARSFDVDCYSLTERMLVQMLYTGAFVGEKMDIFQYYVSQGAKQEVEEAFLAQCSYDYFVKEKITGDDIFQEIQNMYQRGERLQKVCKLAFLKYFAENRRELDEAKKPMAEAFLKEMMAEKLHLNFFREYREFRGIMGEMEDKTIIEYRGHPEGKVRIHYVIVHEDGESGEYRCEYMREVYGGVCFKEFVLFFGEKLQYYIVEEGEGGEQLTESGSLQKSDALENMGSNRFEMINDMVISNTLQDYDTLDRLLEEYCRREYLNNELFKLL